MRRRLSFLIALATLLVAPAAVRSFENQGNQTQLTQAGAAKSVTVCDVFMWNDSLVAKYADHCPLYRQSQILARQGIVIDRSTLAFWVGYAAAEIRPLWRLMRQELLRSTKLFVDETTAPVLDPGRGRTT